LLLVRIGDLYKTYGILKKLQRLVASAAETEGQPHHAMRYIYGAAFKTVATVSPL
jgi:hypothetical protein